jgi:hypothetical protein
VSCGAGPCIVECAGNNGCKNVRIEPGATSRLCILCGGNGGCDGLRCSALPAATKQCAESTNGKCSAVNNCGTLATVQSCN